MKFLRVLCVLAVALCLAGSVYAETQSVKVSGDLTMRGIFRNAYDYQSSPNENQADPAGTRTGVDRSNQEWFMTVAEVEVDADLTDNVQTVIRLVNQRDWNVYGKSTTDHTSLSPNGRGGYITNADEFDVMVDLAYVTLKDFIYSPLTVTIGRQDLWFGKGFIVGANQQDPGSGPGTNNILGTGNLAAPEYTAINSFDAVKAVLDYDPWTITGIWSNIYTDEVQANDDVNLWGVNVGYKFNSYKAEAEGYWFFKQDNEIDKWRGAKWNNNVYTVGLRGSMDPIDIVTIAAEGAYQGGNYIGSRNQEFSRRRSAWALDVAGELRYFTDKHAWKPKLGAEYILYSGNDPGDNPNNESSVYGGWDSMYRGKFDSAIREFVGKYYSTYRYGQWNTNTQSGGAAHAQTCTDDSRTNQSQMIFMGSVQPIDSLTVKANYNLFWTLHNYMNETSQPDNAGGFIGQEFDINVNWDYTEDVSFGLLAGWFMPGSSVYYDDRNKIATDLVGTVKVSF